MNLKKIREDNVEDKFIESLNANAHRLNQMEQDIFNIVCNGHIKHLPLNFIVCSYMWDYFKNDEDMKTDCNYSYKEIKNAMNKPVQLHYATGIKPWKNVDCTKSEIWFSYIVKTPFIKGFLHDLPHKIVLPEDRVNEIISSSTIVESINKENPFKKFLNKVLYRIKKVIKKLVRYEK